MKSYASIEEFDRNYVRLEVEMMDIEDSNTTEFGERETKMIDVDFEKFPWAEDDFDEGDIVVVEHDGEIVSEIYGKDEEERQRRMDKINSILGL